jgi:hypothetical protein
MSADYRADAAAALTGKAARIRASITPQGRGAEGKQRLAELLELLAPLIARGAAAVLAEIGNPHFHDVRPDDRRQAANEIYSLALRREQKAVQQDIRAPLKPGWEPGSDDFGVPIHRATLQEAVGLLELAEAMHPEPFWTWTRACWLERLSAFSESIAVLEGIGVPYSKHAPRSIARCRAKAAGNYDSDAVLREWGGEEFDGEELLGGAVANEDGHPHSRTDVLGSDPDIAGTATASSVEKHARVLDPGGTEALAMSPDLERAASAAQLFAERLADGDFEGARTMLSDSLAGTGAGELRDAFEEMTMFDEVPQDEPVEIIVMMAQDNMPSLEPGDLGWVYVAITGSEFNEALTLIVTEEEGEARIRDIEWGRP